MLLRVQNVKDTSKFHSGLLRVSCRAHCKTGNPVVGANVVDTSPILWRVVEWAFVNAIRVSEDSYVRSNCVLLSNIFHSRERNSWVTKAGLLQREVSLVEDCLSDCLQGRLDEISSHLIEFIPHLRIIFPVNCTAHNFEK